MFANDDKIYMELAKDPKGNRAELQDLVDKYAKRNGYTVRAYHGTSKKFRQFKSQYGLALWFTEDKGSIERGESGASGTKLIMDVYLNPGVAAGREVYESKMEMQIVRDYDSVKLEDTWIIFSPYNIKSANIVTYNGKYIIPLSERFDISSKDIRY